MSVKSNKKKLLAFKNLAKKYKNLYVINAENIKTSVIRNLKVINKNIAIKKINCRLLERYLGSGIKIAGQNYCIMSDIPPSKIFHILAKNVSYRLIKKGQNLEKMDFEIPAQNTLFRANAAFHNIKSKYPLKLKKGLVNIAQPFTVHHPGGVPDKNILDLACFILPKIVKRELKIMHYKDQNGICIGKNYLQEIKNFLNTYKKVLINTENFFTKKLVFTGHNFLKIWRKICIESPQNIQK